MTEVPESAARSAADRDARFAQKNLKTLRCPCPRSRAQGRQFIGNDHRVQTDPDV